MGGLGSACRVGLCKPVENYTNSRILVLDKRHALKRCAIFYCDNPFLSFGGAKNVGEKLGVANHVLKCLIRSGMSRI